MSEENIEEQPEAEEQTEEPITETITKKDPKRVEQGKRLAAISKQAKEDKLRKKIKAEEFSYFPYFMYTLAVVSSMGLMYSILGSSGGKNDLQPMTVYLEKKENPKKEDSKKENPKVSKKNFASLD